MFGFPSYYDTPRRSAYQHDPFGGYARRPQPTYNRNPYGYQYDPRYQQEDSDEEEQEYTRPQRVAPQQQVRLDHLTPQQQLYLQQQQQKQQQQRLRQEQQQRLKEQQLREHQLREQQLREQQLREQQLRQQQMRGHHQEEEEEEEEEEQPQHQQHRRQPRTHHKQQRKPHQPQPSHPQPQTKKLVEVDQDKEALKIQRQWRGWAVRRYDLIAKLRALAKIEAEVDAVVATPTSKTILGLNPSEPLPPSLDTYYVGNIPRNVLMLEHELTAKLIALDGISGMSEVIRPRRKALATKIEQILSKVDAIKKVYSTMTPPPNPTPVISTPEDAHSSTTPTHTTTTTQDKKKEREDNEEGLTAGMDSMDIQDVSETTPTIPPPTITPTTSSTSTPSTSSIPSHSSPSTTPTSPSLNRVMPLKQMCFNLCDSLIKRGLVH